MIYLDNNATTPLLEEVRDIMCAAMSSLYGNPSSAHALGRASRVALAQARESVARLMGADDPTDVLFTSGGTEANNVVILSAATSGMIPRIITTEVEHSSILRACEASAVRHMVDVVVLPVNSVGQVDINHLKEHLTPSTSLVSIQYVNNETGVVQEIENIGRLCSQAGILFHTDASQAYGKIPLDVSGMPIDFLTCSAHKLGGPKGIGALYVRDKRTLRPLMFGGPQEFGMRSGTENLVSCIGFGEAAVCRWQNMVAAISQMRSCRDAFESQLASQIVDLRFNGASAIRVCNTSNVMFPGIEGAAMVAQLDTAEICCSQNSACNNQRPEPSHVLTAMGMTEDEAFSCIRFCFSPENTQKEVSSVVAAVKLVYDRLTSMHL